MDPLYKIRKAIPGDRARIHYLMREAHIEQCRKHGVNIIDEGFVSSSSELLFDKLGEGEAQCWLAVLRHNDLPVAYAFIGAGEMGNGLFTMPTHRTHGIGKGLMAARNTYEASAGCGVSELTVASDNNDAISIYRDLGYTVDAERSNENTLRMIKRLAGAAPDTTPSHP